VKHLNRHQTNKPQESKEKPESVPSARHIAITILHQCHTQKHTLDYWLDRSSPQIDRLNRPDRALVHALVYGVLRWQSRLDWIIDQLALQPGKKVDPLVRIVLRMGLFQILYLDRIPPSAAVNTAVAWVKKNHRSWSAGFVNSLLRRAATQTDRLQWPDNDNNPIDAIAIQHAFPSWLINRWVNRFGVKETTQLCQAINTIAPITLRTNTLKTTRPELAAVIEATAQAVAPTRHSPEGLCFVAPQKPVAQWPAFRRGEFQIQDEAAQLVGHLLSPQPGQSVWDACAGLGTKTAHIAQLMENQGLILATDHRADKLSHLNTEMQRLSVTIVQTRCLDLKLGGFALSKFDRILLDAPCSGLGVLQKNPDGKWRVQPKDLKKNALQQLAFLEQVIPHLAPDGIVVYAVCSTEPEENEQVIDLFLQKHQEFGIHTGKLDSVANPDEVLTPQGFLRTFPHRHAMDGFFAMALTSKGRGRNKYTNLACL
jgi:16S rRNA (cytosine967-C5)-methyltransferase